MAEIQKAAIGSREDTLRFLDMVSLFGSQAMMALGKLANPMTGKAEKNLDAARLFIEFVGDKRLQRLAAEKTFRLPARTDLGDELPAWARDVEKAMVPAEMDWALIDRDGSAWMATWDRTIRGKGAAVQSGGSLR